MLNAMVRCLLHHILPVASVQCSLLADLPHVIPRYALPIHCVGVSLVIRTHPLPNPVSLISSPRTYNICAQRAVILYQLQFAVDFFTILVDFRVQ